MSDCFTFSMNLSFFVTHHTYISCFILFFYIFLFYSRSLYAFLSYFPPPLLGITPPHFTTYSSHYHHTHAHYKYRLQLCSLSHFLYTSYSTKLCPSSITLFTIIPFFSKQSHYFLPYPAVSLFKLIFPFSARMRLSCSHLPHTIPRIRNGCFFAMQTVPLCFTHYIRLSFSHPPNNQPLFITYEVLSTTISLHHQSVDLLEIVDNSNHDGFVINSVQQQ